MKQNLLLSAMIGAVAVSTACSSDSDTGSGGEMTPPPMIVLFSPDTNSVRAGGIVNIDWQVENAERIEISQTGYDMVFTSTELTGRFPSQAVNQQTTFVLTAFNGELEAESSPIVVDVAGVQIARFRATPETIAIGESAELDWEITGGTPNSVEVFDDEDNSLYQGTETTDSITVTPARNTEYTLNVDGQERVTSVIVTANTNPPVIDSFMASKDTVIRDQETVTLRWNTTNAEEVMILENIDGARRQIRPWNPAGAETGNFPTFVRVPTVNYVLHARSGNNPTVATATVTVRSQAGPAITLLTVDPTEYTQASTVATVRWETQDTDTVALSVNEVDVPNFPSTSTAGTFQVNVTGRAEIELTATNAVSQSTRMVFVAEGFDEPEPNNNVAEAIVITPNGIPVRGRISDATDLDWYRFEVAEANSYLYAVAGYTPAGGCGFDTILRLYDNTGTLIDTKDDGVWDDAGGCAQIHPVADRFATGLAAGTYYLSVGGTGILPTGVYNLTVDVRGAPAGLPPNTVITPIATPDWGIVDMAMFVRDSGINAPVEFLESINAIFQPFHLVDGFFADSFTPIMSHVTSHVTAYDRELQAYLMAGGIERQTTFEVEDIDSTSAVTLAYTIASTSTGTFGTSPDFPLAINAGRIIPHSRFPIRVDVQVRRNGMPWQGPEAQINFPGYDAWPTGGAVGPPANVGEGSSHRHLIHGASGTFGGNSASPGDYEFRVTLQDANSMGYSIVVPFTVQ